KSPEAVEQLEAGIEAAGVGVLGRHGAPGRCINTADIAASGRRAHRYRRNERAVGLAPGGAGVALISARLHHGWLHTERALNGVIERHLAQRRSRGLLRNPGARACECENPHPGPLHSCRPPPPAASSPFFRVFPAWSVVLWCLPLCFG